MYGLMHNGLRKSYRKPAMSGSVVDLNPEICQLILDNKFSKDILTPDYLSEVDMQAGQVFVR